MDSITAKTGNAPIRKLGHTEGSHGGNNPTTAKAKGQTKKELRAK